MPREGHCVGEPSYLHFSSFRYEPIHSFPVLKSTIIKYCLPVISRMQKNITFLAILLLCAATGMAGCTGTPQIPALPSLAGTPAATPAPSAPAQNNLIVSPTDIMPDNNAVSVIVQEKVYDATIPVVFGGGKGQYLVKSARVVLYRSDGQVITENLGIKKDDTVRLQGTKQTDRVVVYVSEVNGVEYKVADVLSEYRTR